MSPPHLPGEAENSFEKWIEAARAGSPEAMGQLVDRFRDDLLLLAIRKLHPCLSAKGGVSDLVQETFLEAQRGIAQFRGTTDAELREWLKTLLDCSVIDFSRRRVETEQRLVARERPAGDADGVVTVTYFEAHERPVGVQDERQLATAVAMLPEEYRRVIELRFREGHSFAEVGRLLDCSLEAAQKLVYRAVRTLRERLGGTGDGPE